MREGSAALSIDSLGARAEVIILRDAGFEHTEEKGEEEEEHEGDGEELSPDGERLSQEAILKSIADAKLEPDQATVNKQIDSIWPPKRSLSPRQQYEWLSKTLRDGWSTPQLKSYCNAKKIEGALKNAEGKEALSSDEVASVESKIGLQWSPWKVGTTPIDKRLPSQTSIAERGNKSEKGTLIWHIIHSHWQLGFDEDGSDAIGELEFKHKHIDIFTAGSRNFHY